MKQQIYASVHLMYFVKEPLHAHIKICAGFCTGLQFKVCLRRQILFFFVSELVLEACPEIHSNSTYLDFNRYVFTSVQKKYRNRQNQMKASVAVGFRILYVIFFCYQTDVILLHEHVSNGVYIIDKVTYNSDTCNIHYIFSGRFY